MGEQHNPLAYTPVTTSVGCLRTRSLSVLIGIRGHSREWDGEVKWYRDLTITTSYVGMKKDNPAPTPDTTYTVTPGIVELSYSRGWDITTVANGDTAVDTDADVAESNTPEVWTPSLTGSPTFASPTSTENATSYTETYEANGIWSGTKTVTQEWSNEITQESLIAALEEARDGITLDGSYFFLQNGGVAGTSNFINDSAFGSLSLEVIEYSLGAYTGRPSIAAVEVLRVIRDYDVEGIQSDGSEFSTDLDEVVDVPPTGSFGQGSFRDDNKQLFGGWRRVDAHDLYPSEDIVSAQIYILPLSGHTFVTSATGTLTTDTGWTKLGGTALDFSPLGAPRSFFWSHGNLTPP